MLYVLYLLLATVVVLFSIKGAQYIDIIDKKSSLSGAFIGGVILAAVTSLPELFTSLSSTILLDQPELVIGNILGSNLFNLAVMAVITLFCARSFAKAHIGKSHLITTLFVVLMYLAVTLPVIFDLDYQILSISLTSIVVAVLYIFSVRCLASDDTESDGNGIDSPLTVKQAAIRFIFMAIGLVISSILITYATDKINDQLQLGTTLAGALFLGIATSLPELSSSITLAKRKNFNALAGNILGSNCFNFMIMVVADLLYFKGSVYAPSADPVTQFQSQLLILFGISSCLLAILLLVLRRKKVEKPAPYILASILMAGCYFAFLILSVL